MTLMAIRRHISLPLPPYSLRTAPLPEPATAIPARNYAGAAQSHIQWLLCRHQERNRMQETTTPLGPP